MNGILIIDKPAGWTSHDVVNRVRKILQQRSIGHLGTLDPMATGVLPMVAGNFTRLAQFYSGSEKTYVGTIRFGFATDTYDAEGETLGPVHDVSPTWADVEKIASDFRGEIEQLPPPFSAKKIKGVPAYKLARRKEEVPLKTCKVEVREFEILAMTDDCAEFRVRVSSGTYVRSLAHDIGQRMGCGAHLQSLRRTACGEFEVADARRLDELEAAGKSCQFEEVFIHPRRLLTSLPSVTVNQETIAYIRNGRSVNLPEFSQASQVKVFSGQRELVAIARRIAGTLFHPEIVLRAENNEDKRAQPSSSVPAG